VFDIQLEWEERTGQRPGKLTTTTGGEPAGSVSATGFDNGFHRVNRLYQMHNEDGKKEVTGKVLVKMSAQAAPEPSINPSPDERTCRGRSHDGDAIADERGATPEKSWIPIFARVIFVSAEIATAWGLPVCAARKTAKKHAKKENAVPSASQSGCA
jgi:hypothetical protein